MKTLRRPVAVWLAIAGLATVGGVLEASLSSDLTPGTAVPIAIGMGVAVAVAWWYPLAGVALQLAVTVVQIPFGHQIYNLAIPLYAIAGTVGMLAAREHGRRFAFGMTLAVLMLAAVLIPDAKSALGDSLFGGLFVVGLPALAGRMYRSRVRLNEELRERARRLADERHSRAEEAAAAERRRIAGELHDLVAHGVSGMVVQAGAARRLVKAGDPRASEAIRAVEDGGREALNELRALLGVLRREDDDLALAPQPSLARLGALVARMRTAGLEVELDVVGEAPPLGPGLDVAGYRVVEEALESALAGEPRAPARVTVQYGAHFVELAIDGATPDAGALVRLRERVGLFGGELLTARRGAPPGVRARLPLTGVVA
jgi:signal transduction histidine kinase